MTAWIILVYGILVAVGGVMGYVKAKSAPSLYAGVAAGLILAGASFAMMREKSFQAGWWVALIVALLLLGRFGLVALKDFKMMPTGLVILLSLIAIVVLWRNPR